MTETPMPPPPPKPMYDPDYYESEPPNLDGGPGEVMPPIVMASFFTGFLFSIPFVIVLAATGAADIPMIIMGSIMAVLFLPFALFILVMLLGIVFYAWKDVFIKKGKSHEDAD